MIIEGEVLRDDGVIGSYRDFKSFTTPVTRFHPHLEDSQDEIVSFTVADLILTSQFIPIDVGSKRILMHHSYSRIETLNQLRFDVTGNRFSYAVSNPKRHAGRVVILGGATDGNWYHWLLNWCLRLVVLQRLRPDLLENSSVRIVVDSAVLKHPYRAVLDAFGIPEHRLLGIDPHIDHRFEDATVTSFCDDQKLYPELIRDFSARILSGLGVVHHLGGRRLFASRQSLPAPKRRIHNFSDLQPVLAAHGFDVLNLGEMSTRDQAQSFHDAEFIVGAHGSDLTNIVFCRPRTRVVVFENRGNVTRGLHLALKCLAEVMDLDYTCVILPSTPVPAAMAQDRLAFFHADYIVDAPAFDTQVTGLLAGQRERWLSGVEAPESVAVASDSQEPAQNFHLSYEKPVDWMPLLFVLDTARQDGPDIVSLGRKAGYFIDGPYELLEPGDYRIRIAIGRDGGDPRPLGFDVYCEAVVDTRIIGTKGLKLTRDRSEHVLTLRVPPQVDAGLGLFCLRLRTLDPVAVRLSSLEVERLPDPFDAALDIEKGFITLHDDADWLPLMEVHDIGYHDGADRCSRNTKPGYFLDGPHELLPEGDYHIAITLGLDGPLSRGGTNPVIAEAVFGGDIILSKPLKLATAQSTHVLDVRLPAYGDNGTEWFALRLRTVRPQAVRVTKLRVWSNPRRVSDLETAEPHDRIPHILRRIIEKVKNKSGRVIARVNAGR